MAQKVLWNFQENDLTWLLNKLQHHTSRAGRLYGFDDFQNRNDMVLLLHHSITGLGGTAYSNNTIDPLVANPPTGMMKTEQGSLVFEDAPITLNINPNFAANGRWDTIVCEHRYVEVVGGIPASYVVIEGVASPTPAKPSPTKPLEQTVVGWLFLPANTSQINTSQNVVWEKAKCPPFASTDYDADIANLQTQIDGINTTITTIQGDITTIQGDITTITNQITVINGQIADLQTQVTDLENSILIGITIPSLWYFEGNATITTLPCSVASPATHFGKIINFTTVVNTVVGATQGLFYQNKYFYAPLTQTYKFLFCNFVLEAIANMPDPIGLTGTLNIEIALFKNGATTPVTAIGTLSRNIQDFQGEPAGTEYEINCSGCMVVNMALDAGDFVTCNLRVSSSGTVEAEIVDNLRLKSGSWASYPQTAP